MLDFFACYQDYVITYTYCYLDNHILINKKSINHVMKEDYIIIIILSCHILSTFIIHNKYNIPSKYTYIYYYVQFIL